MTNPFRTYAEQAISAPVRRQMKVKVVQSETDAPMKLTAQEQAQREKSIQMRLYREHLREELAMARNSEFSEEVMWLETFLRRMTLDDGEVLIDFIKRGNLPKADQFTRYTTLRIIGSAIAGLRAQNGYPPFDDSLPGEQPTVFEIIRAELGVP